MIPRERALVRIRKRVRTGRFVDGGALSAYAIRPASIRFFVKYPRLLLLLAPAVGRLIEADPALQKALNELALRELTEAELEDALRELLDPEGKWDSSS